MRHFLAIFQVIETALHKQNSLLKINYLLIAERQDLGHIYEAAAIVHWLLNLVYFQINKSCLITDKVYILLSPNV